MLMLLWKAPHCGWALGSIFLLLLTVWHYLQHQPFSAIDDTMSTMSSLASWAHLYLHIIILLQSFLLYSIHGKNRILINQLSPPLPQWHDQLVSIQWLEFLGNLSRTIPGVPQYWFHFVFCHFSASGAHTEKHLNFFQQPWKFATW